MTRIVPLLLAFAASAPAAEQWTRLTTPHFEMYTSAGEKKGNDIILYFEQVRSFFNQVSPVKGAVEFPARVVVFRSEKQYKPYAPNEVAIAFYAPGRYRDYIVMGDAEPEHLPAAIHEYVHLVVHHAGLRLPLWLNEGLAEVYSSLKPMGAKALVGSLIPGRIQVLQTQKWMTFEELTSVGQKSAEYNEKNRAGIFYAESWAFVHMLYLTPDYGPKFSAFVAAIHGGRSAAEACQIAYGKSSAQVFADLQWYLRRSRLFGAVFDVKLSKSELEPEASQPAPFESALVLADLLGLTRKTAQAEEAYRKLDAESPGHSEIARSLGYLAWQSNDRDGARARFEKAFEEGERDPEMCYHLGMLELEKDRTSQKGIAALGRAIEVKPDYTDARLQLGLAQLNVKQYEKGLAALNQIHQIDDSQAATLFNALAYASIQTGDLAAARMHLESARKWDRTDTDKQRTENLASYLDSRTHAEGGASRPVSSAEKLGRVEGTAQTMDCEGKRFVVSVDGKPFAFDMPDPSQIALKHKGEGSVEFACGPQKPFHVVVEFAPAPAGSAGQSRGVVRSLEF